MTSYKGLPKKPKVNSAITAPVASAGVRAVNATLSTGITENMGWGYVRQVKNKTMTWQNQALQSAIYAAGLGIFGHVPDSVFDSANPDDVGAVLEKVSRSDMSSYGSIINSLVGKAHIDRFAFMFSSNVVAKILFKKGGLPTKDEVKAILGTALLNSAIYDILDYTDDKIITEESIESVKILAGEMKNSPKVFAEFQEAQSRIFEEVGIEKAGTQEFVKQFKDKKFVYNLAMLSSELSHQVADSWRERNWDKLKQDNAIATKGINTQKLENETINKKLTAEEQEALIKTYNNVEKEIDNNKGDKEIGSITGLNRIKGYENEIKELKNAFIIPVKLEQEGLNPNIPNAVLFYGPSGTGKTSSGFAISEQSGVRFKKVRLNAYKNGDEFLNDVKSKMLEAEKSFNNDKRRTILQINEFDGISKYSDVQDKFIETMAKASDEFHTTFFLTTNEPNEIPKEYLDKNISSLKIPFGPASDKDTADIMRHYLSGRDVSKINFEKLAEKIQNNPAGSKYSNTQLENMMLKYPKNAPLEQDALLCYIESKDAFISPDVIKKHETERKNFNKEDL